MARPRGSQGQSGAAQMVVDMIRHRQEAPQRKREAEREEETFQIERRKAGFQEILNLLSLGDKPGAAEAFARITGRQAPTRDVTTRELAHEPVPGEDVEAQAFIPRVERTRTESALETGRERAEREASETEERESRGERRRFALGQEGAEATEQRVRDRPPRTSDELGVSLFRKAAKGEQMTPSEQEFIQDFVRAQRKDPNFKQEFENRIFEKLRIGGEAILAPHERDYYLSNIQQREPGAAARGEQREERRLGIAEESLQSQRGAREEAQVARGEVRASNERNRVFNELDRARQTAEKKFERRRETVPLGANRQQALAAIDAAEDHELAQLTERMKKRNPKYAPDIDAQYGGSTRPPQRQSFGDIVKESLRQAMP